jgi:hypothetical protein
MFVIDLDKGLKIVLYAADKRRVSPDAQVIEDGPYYLVVLDEADDRHDSLTFWADHWLLRSCYFSMIVLLISGV